VLKRKNQVEYIFLFLEPWKWMESRERGEKEQTVPRHDGIEKNTHFNPIKHSSVVWAVMSTEEPAVVEQVAASSDGPPSTADDGKPKPRIKRPSRPDDATHKQKVDALQSVSK
jgi:hypothetical protein